MKTDVTTLAYTGKCKSDFAKLARACAREAAGTTH